MLEAHVLGLLAAVASAVWNVAFMRPDRLLKGAGDTVGNENCRKQYRLRRVCLLLKFRDAFPSWVLKNEQEFVHKILEEQKRE